MEKNPQATTMSVPEMRELLGLKKTESYWLLKKGYFETVQVAGMIRVVKRSFEDWYVRQDHYCKVGGPAPGELLREESLSIKDTAAMLAIDDDSARDMVYAHGLPTVMIKHQLRVLKKPFIKWLATQKHYRTPEQREADADAESSSLSFPEIARMLGKSREATYGLVKRNQDQLTFVCVAGRRRVTKSSFERWYRSQNKYKKCSDTPAQHEDLSSSQSAKSAFTLKEAALLLGTDEKSVYTLIRDGVLPARKAGKHWWISRDDIDYYSIKHNEKGG